MTAQDILWWAVLGLIFAINKVGDHYTKKLVAALKETIRFQAETIVAKDELIETMQGMAQLDQQVQSVLVQKLKDGGQL